VAQLFFKKIGPGVPPKASTFVGLAVYSWSQRKWKTSHWLCSPLLLVYRVRFENCTSRFVAPCKCAFPLILATKFSQSCQIAVDCTTTAIPLPICIYHLLWFW
jgi:hypothetical protein